MGTRTYLMQDQITFLCKIGVSDNPVARLADIQVGCPGEVVLVGWFLGDVEATLHCEFKNDRYRGEWFRVTKRLVDYVYKEAEILAPISLTADANPIREEVMQTIAERVVHATVRYLSALNKMGHVDHNHMASYLRAMLDRSIDQYRRGADNMVWTENERLTVLLNHADAFMQTYIKHASSGDSENKAVRTSRRELFEEVRVQLNHYNGEG